MAGQVRVRKRERIHGKGVVKFHICVYKFKNEYDYLGLEILVIISNSAVRLLFL